MKITQTKDWLQPWMDKLAKMRTPINRFQGSKSATVLLIAPPPTEAELNQNLCWCNPLAEIFFEIMQANVPLTANQFLIMPASFSAQTTKNFRQADADFGREVVAAAAGSSQIKGFVCIGSEAFKAYFGFGRRPSMNTLSSTVLQVTQTKFKPLMVFPDLDLLLFNIGKAKAERMPYREQNQRLAAQKQLINWLNTSGVFQRLEEICH